MSSQVNIYRLLVPYVIIASVALCLYSNIGRISQSTAQKCISLLAYVLFTRAGSRVHQSEVAGARLGCPQVHGVIDCSYEVIRQLRSPRSISKLQDFPFRQ